MVGMCHAAISLAAALMAFLNREYRATIGGLCALQTKKACCKPTGCSGAKALNTIACRAASGEQPAFGMVKTYAIWCALHNEQRRNLQDWLHGGASVDALRGRANLVCGGYLERKLKPRCIIEDACNRVRAHFQNQSSDRAQEILMAHRAHCRLLERKIDRVWLEGIAAMVAVAVIAIVCVLVHR